MIKNHPGELAALATAFFWAITSLSFTLSAKKIGSLSVNFWRLIVGIFFISIYVVISGENVFPINISHHSWFWLSLSGVVGIFLGDLFLFKSFTITGPRISLLIMSISPIFATIISWFLLGETLSWIAILGMITTISGIFLVLISRNKLIDSKEKKITLNYDKKGVFFAFLGAIGQATGLVFSKIGLLNTSNPFVATQIRLYAGLLGFIIFITWLRRWKNILIAPKNKLAFGQLTLGSFFGPFLGISFSLIAVKYTNPGIVQTIAGITPIIIIPFSIFFNKEKVSIRDFIGAVIAVIGVSMFFL
jgi:drug/metabolite transporter (DMT)-like permease